MISIEQSVSEIVRQNYQSAEIFSRHGISYCCGGDISLKEACLKKDLDPGLIVHEIEVAIRPIRIPGSTPFHSWNLAFMIDYIINVHHAYTREALPRLETCLTGFHEGHRNKYPQTGEIIRILQDIASVISAEMKQEEEIIFPYIKQLEFIERRKEPYGPLFVKTLSKPINKLDKNNSTLRDLLGNLAELTGRFTCPENACTRMRVIYCKLREAHDDIVQHKHMENSFLFPAASKIEACLLNE